MKYLALCLVFSMLFSLSLQTCDGTVSSPSAETCSTIELTEGEKVSDDDDLNLVPDTCCYVKAGETRGCSPFKKANITDYIKAAIKEEDSLNVTISCGDTTVSSDDLKDSNDSESSDDSGKFLSLASGLLFLLLLA